MVPARYNPVMVGTIAVGDRGILLKEAVGCNPVVAVEGNPAVAVEGNPVAGRNPAVGHNPVVADRSHMVGEILHMVEVVRRTTEGPRHDSQGLFHIVGAAPHTVEIEMVVARIVVQVV